MKKIKQSKAKSKKITKDMTFGDIMKKDPSAASKLSGMGMMCMGCPMAMSETLEQGAEAHGMETKEILRKLNKK